MFLARDGLLLSSFALALIRNAAQSGRRRVPPLGDPVDCQTVLRGANISALSLLNAAHLNEELHRGVATVRMISESTSLRRCSIVAICFLTSCSW